MLIVDSQLSFTQRRDSLAHRILRTTIQFVVVNFAIFGLGVSLEVLAVRVEREHLLHPIVLSSIDLFSNALSIKIKTGCFSVENTRLSPSLPGSFTSSRSVQSKLIELAIIKGQLTILTTTFI